ncbi:MAG TPA: hypothetical protein VFE46_15275 [Pirellulales bacterium]|nr:hypothetical protein [Pirellulales bacterium]
MKSPRNGNHVILGVIQKVGLETLGDGPDGCGHRGQPSGVAEPASTR